MAKLVAQISIFSIHYFMNTVVSLKGLPHIKITERLLLFAFKTILKVSSICSYDYFSLIYLVYVK